MSLLREAQLRGHLDCSRARPLDRDWWLLVHWTLNWLEQQLVSEVCSLKYNLHIALLEYALEQKTFDFHWDQAQELQARITHFKLPWIKLETGPSQTEIKTLASKWKQIFGDPEDPGVADRIAKTVAALRGRAA